MTQLGVRMINIDFWPLLGGAQMHTLRLARYLSQHGVDVQVITRHHPGLPLKENIDGVSVYRTPIWHPSKPIASLSFTFHALRWLRSTRQDYQVIHSHEMLSPMTIGLAASQFGGAHLVINPHRGGYLGDVYKLVNRRPITGNMRLRWAQRRGDAFVAVSREIASELEAVGIPKDKIWPIPYILDTDHFRPAEAAARAELRSQLGMQDGFWACYAGRLVPEKGLNVLLKAWEMVARCNPEARLVIVGDGDQRSHLEELSEIRGIEGRVRFTGAVADTVHYLQASDVYVQPSFTEGLPISVLEAMGCSLPVIATGVGGVTDLLSNGANGLIIPPHDPDVLSDCLLEMLSNPDLRHRLGSQARQDVTAYCAIDKVGQAHLELYRRLVDGQPYSPQSATETPET
jgi:glycosyltransferase involved in cell wall biosynthesis